MARPTIWKPLLGWPDHDWRTLDGAIRRGTRILADHWLRGDVYVNLRTARGYYPLRKKDLIAVAAKGPPPFSDRCWVCGRRVRYICAQLNGQRDDVAPANLKYVPNFAEEARHGIGPRTGPQARKLGQEPRPIRGIPCLERLVLSRPHHGAEGRHACFFTESQFFE
jgi:hypothetical protein